MYSKLSLLTIYLLLIPLSGCVSKIEFDEINENYLIAQKQIDTNKKKNKKIGRQLQTIKREKVELSKRIKSLQDTIEEKEIIISIQGRVIKFLDDPNQTLQKSIKAQVTAQLVKK